MIWDSFCYIVYTYLIQIYTSQNMCLGTFLINDFFDELKQQFFTSLVIYKSVGLDKIFVKIQDSYFWSRKLMCPTRLLNPLYIRFHARNRYLKPNWFCTMDSKKVWSRIWIFPWNISFRLARLFSNHKNVGGRTKNSEGLSPHYLIFFSKQPFSVLKFGYSEKATKFEKIFHLKFDITE